VHGGDDNGIELALRIMQQMQQCGIMPNKYTCPCTWWGR